MAGPVVADYLLNFLKNLQRVQVKIYPTTTALCIPGDSKATLLEKAAEMFFQC